MMTMAILMAALTRRGDDEYGDDNDDDDSEDSNDDDDDNYNEDDDDVDDDSSNNYSNEIYINSNNKINDNTVKPVRISTKNANNNKRNPHRKRQREQTRPDQPN